MFDPKARLTVSSAGVFYLEDIEYTDHLVEQLFRKRSSVVVSPCIDEYPTIIGWKRFNGKSRFKSLLNRLSQDHFTMNTKYEIPSSKLESVPIINTECCVNLTSSKIDNSSENGKNSRNKRCAMIYILELFFAVIILCLSGFLVYMSVTSGLLRHTPRTNQTTQADVPTFITTTSNNKYKDSKNLYQYIYKEQLRELSPQLRSIVLQIDGSRLKRRADTSPCHEDMEHCKSIINSMWSIVSIVNNSMPHLQAFLKNVSTVNKDAPKSKFIELVKCLQCKNDSITFVDESGPEKFKNDYRITYEQSDQAQIKSNVDIVTNLLNDSIFDMDKNKNSEEIAKELNLKTTTVRTLVYESTTTETKVTDKVTNIDSKPEETTIKEADGINDMKQTVNVTAKLDEGNVTEIANTVVHPLLHPSNQGHGELRPSEREDGNVYRDVSKSDFRDGQRRIVSKMDPLPGTMPTAETIKSFQQLQLTPTMSWMPYQVCFYGPQVNGQPKQTAPGQIMYPASSPGGAYPISMPPHRQGFQNPNQASSFVQVQAQTVQVLPMQGNNGQFNGNQRVGPTGPGQNFPIFPGHQYYPSAGSNNPTKSPYYCTYIPAPTFQFPAIPGISEYQRSNEMARTSDETQNLMKKNDTSDQRASFSPEYPEACPANFIRCGDGRRCILRSQWCNGEVDCHDASDETRCSCRDRISQEKLCDGYFDCPHGEDELGCLGCPKTSFSCNDWQRRYTADNCVPLSQRCDGIPQCANGKDEMDCNILTPSYIEGKNVFTIGYTEGYLHKNFRGQWYPVCTTNDSWAKEACISEIGPEIAEMPEIRIHTVPDNAYRGPYVAKVNGQIKLVPSCMNTAIFVRCPRFPCGTRVFSRDDSLRPDILDKESENSHASYNEILWRSFQSDGNNTDINGEQNEMVGSELRVVGGRASQPKAWPFLVAIYQDGIFHCGGIILNELWVLTAAHCLDGYMGHYYEIQAGMLRRFSFSPMAQFRKARYTVIHPEYSSENMLNDIGVIMLDYRLHFNRWVRPACLPGPDILGSMWRFKPEPNSNCVAIGWGAVRERGPDPDHLREVELPILPDCKYIVDRTDATICAGYPEGGRDACQGDSGGPLMCRNPHSDSQWYVAGIVSHGEGCARPDEPGIYTRVSYFINWIEEVTSGRGGIPPLKRTPLERCPGFSCEGGLGKCLPMKARCDKIVDCLDGEDEINCFDHYPLYRQMDNANLDTVLFEDTNSSSLIDKIITTDSTLIYPTTDELFTEDERINEVDLGDDVRSATTTNNPSYAEISFPRAPSAFPTIFTCTRLLQTIHATARCDKVINCEDGSDEMNCTCRDFLTNSKPNAICDGYTNCDDLTDEENCVFCSENEFFCRKSKMCIPMSKRCNVKFDCEFKEDELDCFTLSNGKEVYLDADKQPSLRVQGVLTRYVDGQWRPSCHQPRIHNNQSSIALIGQNMCEYFGFANLRSSESIVVKNSVLETIPWNKNRSNYETSSTVIPPSEEEETCSGLFIRCAPVLSGNVYTYYRSHVEQWPWLAAISIDGELRCTALLLDENWLLSASKCVENVRPEKNYIAADVGHDVTLSQIESPHQQTSMIDEVHFVNNSVSVLLHLKNSVTFSRQVRPLFLDRKIYLPGMQDVCQAIGTDKFKSRSVSVNPIPHNCPNCQRCFASVSEDECSESETSEWSGTIFCRGKTGWYPAAVFQDNKGLCNFKDPQTMTSIDYIYPYFTEVTDSPRKSINMDELICDGFRCNNGQCVPRNRICDGIPDCRDSADENKEYCEQLRKNCKNNGAGCSCTKMELRCADGTCVDKSTFCDGIVDCPDGSDEPMTCSCAKYLNLTAPERLCDGIRHCLDKTDELLETCLCKDTSFKCKTANGSDMCIPQDFVCDEDKDCLNGEDEATCKMLKPWSENSNKSGEVIIRSCGIWHSQCFPTPLSSNQEASNLCTSMGYSSGSLDNETIVTDEPTIPKLNDFYIVRINNWMWMTLKNDEPLITLEKSNETCHRAFVNCD